MQPVGQGDGNQGRNRRTKIRRRRPRLPPSRPSRTRWHSFGELAKLHEAGALTDEEFAAAKAKALGI